jgi:hypothetical protein
MAIASSEFKKRLENIFKVTKATQITICVNVYDTPEVLIRRYIHEDESELLLKLLSDAEWGE